MAEEGERGAGARLVLLLSIIAELDGDFQLKDLASRAGLPASTVHRLLQVMVRTGLVENPDGSAYRPGREMFRLASLFLRKRDYGRIVRPFLWRLQEKWQETAVFTIYRPTRRNALVVEVAHTSRALRHTMEPLTQISLHWGSLGRAVLAHLPPEETRAVFAEADAGPITRQSITDEGALLAELEVIRKEGHALYLNDEAELAGISAPVFDAGGTVLGSVGLTMPVHRFAQLETPAIVEDVKAAAAGIQDALDGG